MDKLKMKITRFFRTFHIATFGAIACGLNVINALIDLGIAAMNPANLSENIMNLLLAIINCLFYLMLVKNFIRAKQQNQLGLVNYILLIITIFDYVLPTIQMIMVGAFSGGLSIALIATLTSSSILGVLYFVFLAKNNRNVGKNNITPLIVIGTLLFIINAIVGGLYVAFGIQAVVGAEFSVQNLLIAISQILSGIISLLMGALYFGFPLYMKREREKGF